MASYDMPITSQPAPPSRASLIIKSFTHYKDHHNLSFTHSYCCQLLSINVGPHMLLSHSFLVLVSKPTVSLQFVSPLPPFQSPPQQHLATLQPLIILARMARGLQSHTTSFYLLRLATLRPHLHVSVARPVVSSLTTPFGSSLNTSIVSSKALNRYSFTLLFTQLLV